MGENTGFMDKLAELVANFDMANFVPELDTVIGWVELLARLAVMAGPVLVLVFGLIYFFIPPKEANHSLGYRFYWGMGSIPAWRFTQRLAGLVWMCLGLLLSVIMLLICNGFRGQETPQMVESAIVCLLWELGIITVACLAIDVVVLLRYDRKGRVRPNTVIRVPDRFLGIDITEEGDEEYPEEEYPEDEYPEEEYPEEEYPQETYPQEDYPQ